MSSDTQPVDIDSSTWEIPCDISYQALETSLSTVRFIQAHRRDTDGKIILTLKHFSLRSPSCPRFNALSYTWGQRKLHPETIIIDGRVCKVLESIYPILTLICDHNILKDETWFWIDYLCINQTDPEEREAQVALMGLLYERAHKTIVWLGENTPETRGAISTMKTIAKLPKLAKSSIEFIQQSISPEQWHALNQWMLRPWWTRVWTLQEFLLSEEVIFYCGHESITRKIWYKAIISIYDHRAIGYLEKEAFGNQWARTRLYEYYHDGEKMSLVSMMAYVGYYEATDERDRIYALLGLCTNRDDIGGPPDYNTSVDKVYTRLVRNFIRVHRSLNIICFSALFNGPQRLSAGERPLPSWVPDWRRWGDGASRPVPSMVAEPGREEIGNFEPGGSKGSSELMYAASGHIPAECVISLDQRRLTCKGIIIDVVDGLGPVQQLPSIDSADFHFTQSTSEINRKKRKATTRLENVLHRVASNILVEALVRCLSLDRSGRYLSSAARVTQHVHELQHALSATKKVENKPPMKSVVIDWFMANQQLYVKGATLKEHVDAVTLLPAYHTGTGVTLWHAAESTIGERSWDCRLVVMAGGKLGMAPRAVRKGDVACILLGCSVPVILRRLDDAFIVIGECFLPGLMNGEALTKENEMRDIVLV